MSSHGPVPQTLAVPKDIYQAFSKSIGGSQVGRRVTTERHELYYEFMKLSDDILNFEVGRS